MRGRRLILISTLTIFMVIGISLGSASALDLEDWADKWFKTQVKLKAVCEDLDSPNNKLFKGSGNERAWIYIDESYSGGEEIPSYLITKKSDDEWQATPVTLTRLLGSAKDAVLESEDDVTIIDGDNEIEVFYIVRLTGKEKGGGLKSAKLQSVAGLLRVADSDDDCYGTLTLKGTLTKAGKVPQAVIDAKDAAEIP